ncbi:hypothetical protein U0070_003864 [Myodes glareolus]|uniref:Uncharacterized protein n=1 Tax=Myodes glareolus TaxID=447135 RepID=A0AAW0HUP7_MYOGA
MKVVNREFTINIHKRIHGVIFKKRAPRALKEIHKFTMKEMGTSDYWLWLLSKGLIEVRLIFSICPYRHFPLYPIVPALLPHYGSQHASIQQPTSSNPAAPIGIIQQ